MNLKTQLAILLFVYTLGFSAVFADDAKADGQQAVESDDTSVSESADESGGNSAADMAKKLANPLAAMISLPMQLNYDQDFGTGDTGSRYLMNVQPVVPFSINDNWNLISRTILPVVTQDEVAPGTGRQSGLGDTVESLWFSPVKPTNNGWILGIGPAILIPTATDDLLGGGKWGIGPTVVGLKQNGPWTVGGLANHIWSVAGSDNRNDISNTFIQPFLNYSTPNAWTYALNLESTYDWENKQWSIPVNLMVSKLKIHGKQLVSYQGGLRYWLESPDSGPEGLGLRFAITLLFPK